MNLLFIFSNFVFCTKWWVHSICAKILVTRVTDWHVNASFVHLYAFYMSHSRSPNQFKFTKDQIFLSWWLCKILTFLHKISKRLTQAVCSYFMWILLPSLLNYCWRECTGPGRYTLQLGLFIPKDQIKLFLFKVGAFSSIFFLWNHLMLLAPTCSTLNTHRPSQVRICSSIGLHCTI